MTIFVVFRAQKPELLGPVIAERFPDDHYKIQHDEWLISAEMTPKEVSDTLGITEATNGSAIVFSMRSYFGRAPSDVWDWIKTKTEKADG